MEQTRWRTTTCGWPILLAVLAAGCAPTEEGADGGGEAGALQLEATTAPDPPTVGQATLTVTVLDAARQGVAGVTLAVDVSMPAHGHGAPETPAITDAGDGTYTVFPVTFSMPGTWQVTVTADDPASGAHGERVWTWEVQ